MNHALNHYLKESIEGFTDITEINQLAGGYSNLTFEIKTTTANYILRQPPKGAENIKGGHDMHREFNILKKLKDAGYTKIPNPILYCDDPQYMGNVFYIMSKLEGTVLRPVNIKQFKEQLNADNVNVLSKKLCHTLAELHLIDIEKTDLISIGKPNGYIKRQVEGWFGRYDKSKTDEVPEFQFVYDWLIENMPDEIKPTLIHNDFKYDNVIFDLENNEILAVLDWEMTTVGDPRMDIGTCLSYWCENTDGDLEKTFNITWMAGNLTRDEFVKEYLKINPINLEEVLYFYVFGLFKNSVVLQQIYFRYHQGLTNDSRFANLNHLVKHFIKKAKISILKNEMK